MAHTAVMAILVGGCGPSLGEPCAESDLPPPFCHARRYYGDSETSPRIILALPGGEQSLLFVATGSQFQLAAAPDASDIHGIGPAVRSHVERALTGDFNADGRLDIALLDYEVLSQDVQGDYRALGVELLDGQNLDSIVTGPSHADWRSVGALDVDGDGVDEVVSIVDSELQARSVGTQLGVMDDYRYPLPSCSRANMVRDDFDGDTQAELAVVCHRSVVLLGAHSPWAALDPIELPQPALGVAAGDVDGDGRADLVVSDGVQITIAGGSEGGLELIESQSFEALGLQGRIGSPTVADIDGNGRAEIVVRSPAVEASQTSYVLWDGDLEGEPFVFPQQDVVGPVVDLNGDGRSEIIAYDLRAKRPVIYWSLGQSGR